MKSLVNLAIGAWGYLKVIEILLNESYKNMAQKLSIYDIFHGFVIKDLG